MYNMPTGVYVSEVISGGGAEKQALQKEPLLQESEGTSVDGMDALQEQLQYYKAGEKVKLRFRHRIRMVNTRKKMLK